MHGLRKGRDGLFPKIKYQDYMLITLGEVNDSAGACDGQNPEMPCELWGSSQTQLLWEKLCTQSRTDII